jgi:NAD(P)-dependent dehydrogenase (short-subunit alcohol dehydrogenase family)
VSDDAAAVSGDAAAGSGDAGAGRGEPPVVVVTGASSGIGLSTARAFAARGAQLVLASRSADRLATVASQCLAEGAAGALVVVTDVAQERSAAKLIETAVAAHGRVDVVVHSATVMAYGTIEELPPEIFTAVVDTAIQGTFFVARAALAVFRSQHRGHLVVVNSLLGSIAAPQMGAYVVAKWGQAGLIRVLQLETRDEREILVSSVSPGGVNTPIYSQAANVTGRSAHPPLPVDSPEKVARAILSCVDRRRTRVSVGPANPLIVAGFRVLPKLYDALVTPLLHLASLTRQPPTEPSDGNVLQPQPGGEAEHGRWPGPLGVPHR